jgi:hypothetical protein
MKAHDGPLNENTRQFLLLPPLFSSSSFNAQVAWCSYTSKFHMKVLSSNLCRKTEFTFIRIFFSSSSQIPGHYAPKIMPGPFPSTFSSIHKSTHHESYHSKYTDRISCTADMGIAYFTKFCGEWRLSMT